MALQDWTGRNYYCWICGDTRTRVLETHHMLRGVHRAAADKGLACKMRLCGRCHQGPRGVHGRPRYWTLTRQLAVKQLHDPEHYDLAHVNTTNTLSDKPDASRITQREVNCALRDLLRQHEVSMPQ